MSDILTITLSPTIDKSATVEFIKPEIKMRTSPLQIDAGGGGINVAKALKKVGADVEAVFPAGGHNGKLLVHLMQQHDIKFESIETQHETREGFMITETSTNKQYRFNPPGDNCSHEILVEIITLLKKKNPKIVVASGSLLPGLPIDSFSQIARSVKSMGAKMVLDTSGDALNAGIRDGVFLMKPNLGELARLIGVERLEKNEIENAAKKLINEGNAEIVAVSMAADGAYIFSKSESFHVNAPRTEKKSTVGAGDSMVAGMVYMIMQEKSLEEIVRFGVACGTAATMNDGTELFDVKDVNEIMEGLTAEV